MSYTKRFDKEKYDDLSWVTEKLKLLKPGGRLVVGPFRGERQLNRARFMLYDWLNHMGLKQLFRVRTRLRQGELEVENLQWPEGAEVTVVQGMKRTERLLEELVLAGEPKKKIEQWVRERRISNQDGVELLQRLEEILS